jgi:hypothetical protein
MSGYERRDRAWKQGRARERKTAQHVPQDSQGAEKRGGHPGTLIQAQGGTDGRVRGPGVHVEAGKGLGVQTKCSALWAYWDATQAY